MWWAISAGKVSTFTVAGPVGLLDRVDDDVLVIVIDRPAQDLPRVGAAGFTGLGVAATRFAAEVMLDQLGLGFDS